ncbi:hypothetical protein PR048_033478 [Dryococelus australis]|uniref:Uncharacterized protein n=1 Tax=Dryococelus australis TaxID=614101 RepID=A0ABQ9G0E0_9NEOP|nr:hypothetical protein PR048_033478 [Dryococelus australis]
MFVHAWGLWGSPHLGLPALALVEDEDGQQQRQQRHEVANLVDTVHLLSPLQHTQHTLVICCSRILIQQKKKKTGQPVASSSTVPTCRNPGVTRSKNEPGSPWWEVSRLTAQPPLPISFCGRTVRDTKPADATGLRGRYLPPPRPSTHTGAWRQCRLAVRTLRLADFKSAVVRRIARRDKLDQTRPEFGCLYHVPLELHSLWAIPATRPTFLLHASSAICAIPFPRGPHAVTFLPLNCKGPRWFSGQTTRRTGFDSRWGRCHILACGNRVRRCRWSAGFLGDIPFPPPLYSGAAPYSPQFTLIEYKDFYVKRRQNLSNIHSLQNPLHRPAIGDEFAKQRADIGQLYAGRVASLINHRQVKREGWVCPIADNRSQRNSLPEPRLRSLRVSQVLCASVVSELEDLVQEFCRRCPWHSPEGKIKKWCYVRRSWRPRYRVITTDPSSRKRNQEKHDPPNPNEAVHRLSGNGLFERSVVLFENAELPSSVNLRTLECPHRGLITKCTTGFQQSWSRLASTAVNTLAFKPCDLGLVPLPPTKFGFLSDGVPPQPSSLLKRKECSFFTPLPSSILWRPSPACLRDSPLPPPRSSRVHHGFSHVGRCSWLTDFLGDLPFPPPLQSDTAQYTPPVTLIGSQDLDVKSRPNHSTPLHSKVLAPCIK